MDTVDSADSPIAYTQTLKATNTTSAELQLPVDKSQFTQWKASTSETAKKWKISFWAKTPVGQSATFRYATSGTDTINTNGQWKLFSYQLSFTTGNLSTVTMFFKIPAGSSLELNAPSIVPGTVVLANESHQNSAALKNITINTGTTKFNTAIEYDTDADRTAYSRVKHYINQGKAYSYTYDGAGNISKIQNPDGSYVEYTYDSLNQLIREHHSLPLEGKVSPQATDEVSYDTIEYTYDTRGNILSKTYSLGETTVGSVSYGYETTKWKDRLTSYNGVTIEYDTDADGNTFANPVKWHDGATMTWQRGRQLLTYTKCVITIYSYNDEGISVHSR